MPIPQSLTSLPQLNINHSPPTPGVVPPTASLLQSQTQNPINLNRDNIHSLPPPHVQSPSPGDQGLSYRCSQSPSPLASYPHSPSPSCSASAASPHGSLQSPYHSPLTRSPTHTLSPDLPNRDALYLFCNFSSYMRSPNEGSEGVRPGDFRDTIRLLEHARALTSDPHSNVHILHLKYRFQGQANMFRSPYFSGDYQLPLNYCDSVGRLRNPVPQPFSVLHDPVVKIDYAENGVFEPLPAQAVFSHIAKMCQPPPRIIIVSYVYSKVIENHLASLSTWGLTSSPPTYVFSPLETRLREPQPLHVALHHAIPMSMYAWPVDNLSSPSGGPLSPGGMLGNPLSPKAQKKLLSQPSQDGQDRAKTNDNLPLLITRQISGAESPTDIVDWYYARNQSDRAMQQYSANPVASLTVISSSPPQIHSGPSLPRIKSTTKIKLPSMPTSSLAPQPVERIPLWHLAPGVGILHGSTSVSIGVKLSDFSAMNLVGEGGKVVHNDANKKVSKSQVYEMGTQTSPTYLQDLINPLTLLEQPISRPSSTTPAAVGIPGKGDHSTKWLDQPCGYVQVHREVTHLSPPEKQSKILGRIGLTPLSQPQSWPAPVSRVPGWRKGRKEIMEDTLEELGVGLGVNRLEMGEMARQVKDLVLEEEVPAEEQEEKKEEQVTETDLFALLIGNVQ